MLITECTFGWRRFVVGKPEPQDPVYKTLNNVWRNLKTNTNELLDILMHQGFAVAPVHYE